MIGSENSISRRRLMASAGSLILAGRVLRAQQDSTFSTDVNLVSVFATVRDHKGQIVRNLGKDDFSLTEDGRPQTIKYFSQESGLPLTLGLLVDTSMSQRRVLGKERDASYRFFDQVLREDKDKAFLIHFDHEVELLLDLTSSKKKLESALGQLEVPERQWQSGGGYGGGGRGRGGHHGGGTALYDSILLASDELMKKQTGRKAVIVLTDGVDNGSKVSLSTGIESAQRADTLAYSILFADPEGYGGMGGGMGRHGGGRYPGGQGSRADGKPVLQRLSRETGGGFFEVSKKETIEKIYDQIEEELRNQYSLGYTSDQADAGAGYRKIRLTTRKTDQIVQTRDGYYPNRKT
jgi:VWFA-related protein